jgi:hypothetical protein
MLLGAFSFLNTRMSKVKSLLPALFVAKFRSRFEASIANTLMEAGVDWDPDRDYEATTYRVEIPARQSRYTPEFSWPDKKIIIEVKGRFQTAQERQKYILFAEQHPEYELRFVFMRKNTPIYPKSKTTCEKWAIDHGFKYTIGEIPVEWIKELKD